MGDKWAIFGHSRAELTKLAVRRDLAIGFRNGAAIGSGVAGMTFDLEIDGADLLAEGYASAGNALQIQHQNLPSD